MEIPVQIRIDSAARLLSCEWADGLVTAATFRALRRACRCASCRSANLRNQVQEVPEDIALTEVQPVGRFGVRLCFGDGHDRGIYPWAYLRDILANDVGGAA